ncbi:MAG: D-alanyl-D-alanine carboxypeptidase [Oscillospiraceae bacterium]|jgi:D-alanyl-D-alanine carboxypeptidase (penicillin-binding protein 5/6)|nr:D-alanyl-D-alanine carboxypeptidase [Oscillospiraceae bacterium]
MRKRIITVFAAIILLLALPMGAFAAWPSSILSDSGVKMYSEIYLLANADTGEILLGRDTVRHTPPASLTKIATAAVVLEECSDLTQRAAVQQRDLDEISDTNSSTAGLRLGESRTLRELLACLLIPSGNDAATVLARYVGGTIPAFVEKMNAFAKSAGCTDTVFTNPHGLDELGHYSCAADILKMTRKAMEYPVFAELCALRDFKLPASGGIPERKLLNTNKLMNSGINDYYSPYATGVKTGNTDGAGQCVVGFAQHNGYSYYTVVMQGKMMNVDDDEIDENTAFVDSKALFAWAFDRLRLVRVASPLDVAAEVPLLYSKERDRMPLSPAEEIYLLVPDGVDASGLLTVPVADSIPAELKAPVAQGTPAGEAKILYANKEIASIKLVTQTDARRSSFLYAVDVIGDVAGSLPFRLVAAVLLLLIAGYVFFTFRKRRKKLTPRPVAPGVRRKDNL